MTEQLEQRISAALSGATITSDQLGHLVLEVVAAIPLAQEAVAQARSRLLDPRKTPDTRTRQALQDASVAVERLGASIEPLRKRVAEVYHDEELQRWRPQFEALRAQRDELAARLEALYAPFERDVVPLLAAIEKLDTTIRLLNMNAPRDGASHLGSVEEHARTVAAYDLLIARDLRLPSWRPSAQPAWPPNRAIDAALLAPMAAADSRAFSGDWWQVRRAAR
jgi:hypothetical protein